MNGYVILTNGRRAIIALVHSVVFLLIAMRGIISVVRPLHVTSPASAWMMCLIYLVVSSILIALTAISGSGLERLYFAFCSTSAGFGLLRSILGDPRMHLAVYVRVAMLVCAVVVGTYISRAHWLARPAPAPSTGEPA